MTEMYEPDDQAGPGATPLNPEPFAAPSPAGEGEWWKAWAEPGRAAPTAPPQVSTPPNTSASAPERPPASSASGPDGSPPWPLRPAPTGAWDPAPTTGAWDPAPTTGAWDPALTTGAGPAGGWGSPPGANPPPPGWGPHPGAPGRSGPPPWGYGPAGSDHRSWYQRPAVVAALVAATLGAGIGVGHGLARTATPIQTSASVPGASGGSSATVPSTGGSSATSPYSGSSGGSGSSSSSGSSGPADAAAIAAKVDPALVDINVTFGSSGAGAGTGIVLSSNGEVLTNNHVVEGATTISVVDLGNGRTYSASVVGYDRAADVAVIQLANASGLQTATIGDSSKVSAGDAVVGIGNAGGTGGTPSVAAGAVTALNQSITASDQATGTSENLTGLIETNADIQPGDSGGSLVNASGQVIGMDTAAAQGYSFSYQGSQVSQGYAIPINKAVSIASQIEAGQATSSIHVGPTAYLGVYISAGSSQGGFSGLGGQSGTTVSGAYVSGVVTGGPAAQAGLGQGDVITSVDGTSIASAADLTNVVAQHKPGQSVQVGWTDSSGATHSSTLVLGTGPAQ